MQQKFPFPDKLLPFSSMNSDTLVLICGRGRLECVPTSKALSASVLVRHDFAGALANVWQDGEGSRLPDRGLGRRLVGCRRTSSNFQCFGKPPPICGLTYLGHRYVACTAGCSVLPIQGLLWQMVETDVVLPAL